MPGDRHKGLQTAERLLKQGRVQAALSELQRVSEGAPDDLLTLNRLGDLLARQGRNGEAIDYYRRIAEHFARGGFLPKAAAIHKKILRLDPQNLESLTKLGELYIKQNLQGEARNYLLHAANQYCQSRQFARAREVYEKLVAAEPGDPCHRVRLAETRAAEGNLEGAGRDLVRLGAELLAAGDATESEKVFERASQLLPKAPEPLLGLVDCLAAQKRDAEALQRLEQLAGEPSAAPVLVGELALRYERAGRPEQAVRALVRTRLLEVPVETWRKLLGLRLERGTIDGLWTELDSPLRKAAGTDLGPLAELLEQLADFEAEGHLPALERLLELQRERGDDQGILRALEWLSCAYQARSMDGRAAAVKAELRRLAPSAPRLVTPAPVKDQPPKPGPAAGRPRPGALRRPTADVPLEAEAPAVPLSRADQEFAAGRLTQAEVLEKYGLRSQALEQLQEVTSRFPGHVGAQRSRIALLRTLGDEPRLAAALVELALAQRAAGDGVGADRSAVEASSSAPLAPQARRVLEQSGLLEPAAGAEPTEQELQDVGGAAPVPPAPVALTPVAVDVDEELGGAIDLVIDLDESTEVPAEPVRRPAAATAAPRIPVKRAQEPQPPAPAPRRSTRTPSPDMIEEIDGYLARGVRDEAHRRLDALRTLGYASEELDELASRIEAGPAADVPALDEALPGEGRPSDEPAVTEEPVELATVFEGELFEDVEEPPLPAPESEQSIEEVFASFKLAVREQVGSDDYRTHYDLGIAYKEMGLTAAAIGEFKTASNAAELYREACTMIGLCHWELAEMEEAARWYRLAIDAADGEAEALSRLRYDLGEVLLQAGDTAGALSEFRDVLKLDPSYRDVSGRVSELESGSGS